MAGLNDQSPEVLAFRVGEMEKGLTGLRGELKEAVGTLGGGMTALQTQLINYQSNMSDKYALRRDLDEVKADVQAMANRGWVLGVAMLASITSIIVAVIGWLRPGH